MSDAEQEMAISVIYDRAAHTMMLHIRAADGSGTSTTMPFEEFARLTRALTEAVATVRDRQERRGRERRN